MLFVHASELVAIPWDIREGAMEHIHVIMAGVTAIILFVFGLESFSAEIEQISGERFRRFLARATKIPAIGR